MVLFTAMVDAVRGMFILIDSRCKKRTIHLTASYISYLLGLIVAIRDTSRPATRFTPPGLQTRRTCYKTAAAPS